MSALTHLRALAQGRRPSDESLLGNARCAWDGGELLGDEPILAAFAAQPFDIEGEIVALETPQGAALIAEDRALVVDLYASRIGRMWRVGAGIAHHPDPAVDVAFDADLSQERGDLSLRPEDHPGLDPAALKRLLTAGRDLIECKRSGGKLRVRGFVVRAFGGSHVSAALLSLFMLGNEVRRSASFSYAVVAVGSSIDDVLTVCDDSQPRDWTPRL